MISEASFDSLTGRYVFQNLYQTKLAYKYNIEVGNKDINERPIASYKLFFSDYHHLLAHYFRVLYHIFKFIDTSQLSEDDKSNYANIARAQLSSYELCLMFYNGIYGEGKVGFKPLIEKYGILKHLDTTLLLNPEHRDNRMFYNETAFLGRSDRATIHGVMESE